MEHIVIFRTSGSYIDYSRYNCQELGLAKALAKRGYRVSLIMGGPKCEHIVCPCNGCEVDVYYLTYKGVHQSLCLFRGWRKLLDEIEPTLVQVHEFGMFMSFLVARWARRRGVKSVLVQGNYDPTRKPLFKQYEHVFNTLFGQSVLRNVTAIGCKTKAAAEYVHRYCSGVTLLTPVGLDVTKLSADCIGGGKTWFTECNAVAGKKVLLYVGQVESRRNPLFLLHLMERLPDDYVLLLVGDGPLFGDVKAYLESHKLDRVHLLGRRTQEELPAIYAAADLFLLASDYEIYGMVILEAMYFGVPVISSSTAGANTIITDETGVIIPSYDEETWAKAVIEYNRDPVRLETSKAKCRSLIREHYVWDKAVDAFIKLYGL